MKRAENKATASGGRNHLTRSNGSGTRPIEGGLNQVPVSPSTDAGFCSLNSYQIRKARLIAATLLLAAVQSDTPVTQLAQLAARMTHRQWITVSLQAGVPVADRPCRVQVVAMLLRLAQ